MQTNSAAVVEPLAPEREQESAPEALPGLSLQRLTQAIHGFSSEQLGDFSIRAGLVRPVLNPVEDFHDPF